MPYIYVDELGEGQEEAVVYSQQIYDDLQQEIESLTSENTELRNESTSLAEQLSDAKTKFADAFLSPSVPKEVPEQKDDYVPSTFDSLFTKKE